MTTSNPAGHRPEPSGAERRQSKRIDVNWQAKVELMFPEETFRPKPMNGIVKNFSKRGMLIFIAGVDQDMYRKLLARQRYMKVYLSVPESELSLEAVGKIVWVDYHANAKPEVFCNVGLFFENLVPAEERQLDSLLASL